MRNRSATVTLASAAALAALAGCGGGETSDVTTIAAGGGGGGAAMRTLAVTAASTPAPGVPVVSAAEAAQQVMDFGEAVFPGFFPGHQASQTWAQYTYRAYPGGTKLGVAGGDVYVMGGPWGDSPTRIGAIEQYMFPSSYVPGSDRAAAYKALAIARAQAGLPQMQQDTRLDAASQSHAEYLRLNNAFGHAEDPAAPGFTGAMPAARGIAAGFGSAVGEVVTGIPPGRDGAECVAWLLNSVYHRVLLLASGTHRRVGIGVAASPIYADGIEGARRCVINPGIADGTTGEPPPAGAGTTWPPADATGVPVAFEAWGEVPNPLPERGPADGPAGSPVSVNIWWQGDRTATDGNVYTVRRFELRDARGQAVPARLLAKPDAIAGPGVTLTGDARLSWGSFFLLPLAPLSPGQRYTASFDGSAGSISWSKTWSFTTAAK